MGNETPSEKEIRAMAEKAGIPDGCTFVEAHVRLRALCGLDDAKADRWAHLITGETIPA